MRNITKKCGIIALSAVIVFIVAACSTEDKSDKTPSTGDFDISGLNQSFDGSEKPVTITPKKGKSTGAITIYYEGTDSTIYAKSTTPPVDIGSYTVTFDVAAASGWKAKKGLVAGKLVIDGILQIPAADDYDINGLDQVYDGSEKEVSITQKAGKSTGARTVYYAGTDGTTYAESDVPPTNAGAYNVTFDVAAATGWEAASGLSAGKLTVSKAAPVAGDYNFGGLNQEYDGDEKIVTVTPKPGVKSPGARTVWYEGTEGTPYQKSTTAPVGAGTYAVTFDVAADDNWAAATGLAAGTLTVELPEAGALRITFSEFGDEEINYADDIDNYVQLGDNFTVVVEGEYDYYMWYFNGEYLDEGIDSIVIDPWVYGSLPGIYYLTIIVEKDSTPYSKTLAIRVVL